MSIIGLGGMGVGGFGMQESDPNLHDKIAKLKQKRRSPQDSIRHFLEQEMGVNPEKLGFSSVMAQDFLLDLIVQNYGDVINFTGNSMGLCAVQLIVHDDTPVNYDSNSPEWHDLKRSWSALTKAHPGYYSFSVDHEATKPVDPPPVKHEDPTKYPPGSVLRVEKQTVIDNELIIDSAYLRIGGLLDDTTPTNLETMQPMNDLTGWQVREEL